MDSTNVRHLLDLIKQQNAAISKLMAERDSQRQEIDALVGWIQEDRDALMCLQSIYNSPTADDNSKIQAARAAINFERAKPAAQTNVSFKLFDYLEAHRLQELAAREAAAKVIEHQPKKPLDLNEPTPTTVLGEGQGHHQAWQDHNDPAA